MQLFAKSGRSLLKKWRCDQNFIFKSECTQNSNHKWTLFFYVVATSMVLNCTTFSNLCENCYLFARLQFESSVTCFFEQQFQPKRDKKQRLCQGNQIQYQYRSKTALQSYVVLYKVNTFFHLHVKNFNQTKTYIAKLKQLVKKPNVFRVCNYKVASFQI